MDYTRNVLGQIDSVTTTQGTTTMLASNLSYRPFGPMNALTYGNGLNHTKTYDLDYRLTGQMTINGHVQQDQGYLYDNANNITQITDHVDTLKTQHFSYDELNRITNATGNYGDIDYSYDPTGNRTSKTADVVTETYTYATDSHHLLQTVNGTTTDYSYDANGNTINNTDYDFSYGDNNRLKEVQQNGAPIATNTYNGRGERVKKEGTSTTLYYYNLSGQLIAELDETGTTIREYIYLDGQPLAQIDATGINYIHTSHLGTPEVITDSGQAVVWKADYDPFGAATITTETITNNLRFAGQYWDSETELHYNLNRYYSPDIGRYITSDPIGLAGGANTYSYVKANPILRTDPLGLIPSNFVRDNMHNKSKDDCPEEEDCSPSIDIEVGVCDLEDEPMCSTALRAAGIQGPYRRETKTYDVKCLLTFGLLFKGGTFGATTAALEKGPKLLSRKGFPRMASMVGKVGAVANNPVTMTASIGVGIAAILSTCECE